jgi:hypothetical protein
VRALRLSLVLLGACSFSKELDGRATPDDASEQMIDAPEMMTTIDASMPPQAFHLRVATIVDGESYIFIKGTTVRFQNRIFAAPGRWDANGMAPWDMAPIMLNSTAWMPDWPDVPNPENRDCMCFSSTTQLPVGIPQVPSTATLTEVDVRRTQSIIQAPSAANDWELIATVSDYMVGGAHASFVLEIDVVPN